MKNSTEFCFKRSNLDKLMNIVWNPEYKNCQYLNSQEDYIPRERCSEGADCQRRCWRSFGRRHALQNNCLRRTCGCNI